MTKMYNKSTATILALLLGGLGVHAFYLGKNVKGLLYLVFSWTFIPSVLALLEFVLLLTMSDAVFDQKFNGVTLTTPVAPTPKTANSSLTPKAKLRSGQPTEVRTPEAEGVHEQGYEECTKQRDWAGICQINSVSFDRFGTKKEIGVLHEYLEPGEVVLGFTSGIMRQSSTSNRTDRGYNTWLVVLTTERFLFLDHAFLTKSVDTQSIRHNKIQAVSASQGFVLGAIQIDIGSRVVVIDNCPKGGVRKLASLANEQLRKLEEKGATPPEFVQRLSAADEIEKLNKLKDGGALTEEEYNGAKAALLKAL